MSENPPIGVAVEPDARPKAAREVLDIHRQLREQFQHPSYFLREYIHGFMTSVRDKAFEEGGDKEIIRAFSALFWPANTAEKFCGLIASEMHLARTFQVSAEMTDAISEVYRKSAKNISTLQEAELPSEAGFVWFDKPVAVTDINGRSVFHRAVSWSPQLIEDRYHNRTHPGVRITAWYAHDDHDSYWTDSLDSMYQKIGSLIISHSMVLPFGMRVGGWDGGAVTMDDFAAWTHTMWMFMDSEVAATTRPDIQRTFRRRAQRSLKHQDVRVVTLRRTAAGVGPEDGVHRHVDWSCRWLVQGHWRHVGAVLTGAHHAVPTPDRTHCVTCDQKLTWVRPHLKGPEGKPLHATADTVYRLSR